MFIITDPTGKVPFRHRTEDIETAADIVLGITGNELDYEVAKTAMECMSNNDHYTDDRYSISNNPAEKRPIGWRPISEYSRDKYDWVLVKYFDDPLECVPEVAEMRVDGKWYNRTGALIDPNVFDVRYFFDMQQLDKEV